jgi:phage regulator Rha-like protein
MNDLIPIENIAQKIYFIRGQKVMLDSDLAVFYGIETKVLNQAVKRNIERFSETFMFQLTIEEATSLRSQIGTSKEDESSRSQIVTLKRGHNIKYQPYAFTEHGVVMLSSILRSKKAAQVSIAVVNAFIKMREYLSTHKQILDKLKKHDDNFVIIFNVLKQLTEKKKEPITQKQIGFKP